MPRRFLPAGMIPLILGALLLSGCDPKEKLFEGALGENGEVLELNWNMASAFSPTLPVLGTSGVHFIETVERISNDRIRINFSEPGTSVPALEIFEATSRGEVDAGWTTAGFWFAKMPAASFFSGVPFGPDTNEYLAWIYEGEGWKLWKELYAPHRVIPIPCAVLPPKAAGWYRRPINKPAQLKGKKMRYYGMGGQALKKLGVTVLEVAGRDIHPALSRKILDATEFYMPSLDEKVGFYKLVKHYYFPGWQQQTSLMELIVNQDRWEALSPGDQALIEVACRDTIVHSIAEGEYQQAAALERLEKAGVKIQIWPDEFLREYRDAYEEVVREYAEKDADFKRIHASYAKFRQRYSDWGRMSRVPRG